MKRRLKDAVRPALGLPCNRSISPFGISVKRG